MLPLLAVESEQRTLMPQGDVINQTNAVVNVAMAANRQLGQQPEAFLTVQSENAIIYLNTGGANAPDTTINVFQTSNTGSQEVVDMHIPPIRQIGDQAAFNTSTRTPLQLGILAGLIALGEPITKAEFDTLQSPQSPPADINANWQQEAG